MDIKNLKTVFERLVLLIETEPDKALSWFISEHKKLSYPEKDVLLPFIRRFHETICLENSLPLENRLYLTEILNEIDSEFMGSGATTTVLTLKDLSIIQIAKLFYELKIRGFIVNTNEEISEALGDLFCLNKKTLLNYLSNPKERFSNIPPLFGEII